MGNRRGLAIDARFRASYNPPTMSSNSPISRFENFARYLIEGSFDRLLREPGPLSEVAGQLAAAAEKSLRSGLVANHYVIKVHPSMLDELGQQTPDVASLMEGMLARFAEQNNLVFSGDLKVELLADPSLDAEKAVVIAEREDEEDEPTAVMRPLVAQSGARQSEKSARKKAATAPLALTEAYLIINGRRHVALDKAINAIGRSLDNDIVLEDPGVSRAHAQIRWRSGQFEIFDLGSRAGVLINGRPVARGILKSGDVITMGSAALIYGEEDRGQDGSKADRRTPPDITQELSTDDLL